MSTTDMNDGQNTIVIGNSSNADDVQPGDGNQNKKKQKHDGTDDPKIAVSKCAS